MSHGKSQRLLSGTQTVVMLSVLILTGLSYYFLDKPIALFFHQTVTYQMRTALENFTQLGNVKLYVMILLLAVLYCHYIRGNISWRNRYGFLLLSLIIVYIVCLVLKIFLGRARPDLWFDKNLYGFYGYRLTPLYWSFPSGHTSVVMSLAFALQAMCKRYGYYALLLGLLVVLTRVLLTHHFLSDVLIATWLAWVEVSLLVWVIRQTKFSGCVS